MVRLVLNDLVGGSDSLYGVHSSFLVCGLRRLSSADVVVDDLKEHSIHLVVQNVLLLKCLLRP